MENTRERHWFDADFKWIITWFSKLAFSNFDAQSFFKPACPMEQKDKKLIRKGKKREQKDQILPSARVP